MNWRPPQLRQVVIERTAPLDVDEPARFLREHLGEGALAVVERAAEVLVVPLADVVYDAGTLHVQAFSSERRAQARLARSLGEGWIGDAVREAEKGSTVGVTAWARAGRHLCLGKSVPEASGSLMLEERVRPYRLPVPLANGEAAEIQFVDYYVIDAETGSMNCIGHRVVAVQAAQGG